MRKILTILIFAIVSISQTSAQQIGFGGQYRIPDSEHQDWRGAQLFFEVNLSERLLLDINIDFMRLTVEVNETTGGEGPIISRYMRSRSPVFGIGSVLNHSLYHPNDHFEVLIGGGVMFYTIFKPFNSGPEGGTGVFGRTDLQTALTLRYNLIANTPFSIYASARPSLMLRSDSHYGADQYVGRQNNMLGLHAGIIYDLE